MAPVRFRPQLKPKEKKAGVDALEQTPNTPSKRDCRHLPGKVYYGSASPTYNNLFPQSLKIFMRTLPAVHLACLFLETALQLAIQKTATPNCCGTVEDPVSLPLPLAKWQYVRWLHEPFLHSHFKSVFDKKYNPLFESIQSILSISWNVIYIVCQSNSQSAGATKPYTARTKDGKNISCFGGTVLSKFQKIIIIFV